MKQAALALAALLPLVFSAPAMADAAPGSSIHGFADVSMKNDYLTPRGLLVHTRGQALQILNGLVLDLYDAPGKPISDVAFVIGTWNDLNPGHRQGNDFWNEFDWFGGVNLKLYDKWKLGAQYVEFISPNHSFNAEQNFEFSLGYDDSGLFGPVTISPYVKLFYTAFGDSTVVTGAKGGTFDVEIGAAPSIAVAPGGVSLTLSAPTWITVGPSDFWGGSSNFGVFTTGALVKMPLKMVPARLGSWYVDAGVQYYHMINSKLIEAQQIVGAANFGTSGHRNEAVGMVGFGFGF